MTILYCGDRSLSLVASGICCENLCSRSLVNFSFSLVVLGRVSSRNREVRSRIFKNLSFLVDLKLGIVLGEVKRVLASYSLQIVLNYDLTCVKIWMAQENFE